MSQHDGFHSFDVHTTPFESFPAYGGSKAILYQAEDRKILAGSFRESGTHIMKMPYDEFIFILAGTLKVTVKGEDSVLLKTGSACYLREGQEVELEMSSDFHDVAVLVSDSTPIDV